MLGFFKAKQKNFTMSLQTKNRIEKGINIFKIFYLHYFKNLNLWMKLMKEFIRKLKIMSWELI